MSTILRVPSRMSLRTAKVLSLIAPTGLMLSMVAGVVLLNADGRVQPVFQILRLVFLATLLLLLGVRRSQSANTSEKLDSLLDVLERAERERAYRKSHKVVVYGIFGLCAYATVARGGAFWLPDVRGAIDIVAGLAFIAMGLPAIILIWRERQVSDDE